MEIMINQASFSLPCKTFLISYSTTKKRPLPVVKEFVVRLIFSLDECKPEIIQQFFGFDDAELQAVLNDLTEERLIIWKTEDIRLSKYAEERFEKINGQMLPRFFEIEDATESVSFDLHSFKILYAGLSSSGRNPIGIDVPLPAKNYSDINSKIRLSFDDQFMLYQEKIKGINIFNDSAELYKINHIISRYDHILPIELNFFIDADRGSNIIIKYANQIVDEWDNQHELFKSIDCTLLRNSDDFFDLTKNLNTYLSITRDPFISKFFVNDDIDITALISFFGSSSYSTEDKMERVIIGNLYNEENIDIIAKMIKENKHNDGKSSSLGAVWLANPNKKTWGRTNNIIDFSKLIKSHLDHRRKTSEVVLILPCESRQEASNSRRS